MTSTSCIRTPISRRSKRVIGIFKLFPPALASLFLLTACASPITSPMHPQDYLDHLDSPVFEKPISETARVRGLEAFKAYYRNVTAESVREKTRLVYAENLYFNDTVKTLRSREALEHYFLETTKNVSEFTVEVLNVAVSGKDSYVRWKMVTVLKKFGNKRVTTVGMTHLRFNPDGKIALHQDYWDSTSGIWEHVPVLGGMIRWIKSRL